MMFWFWLTLLCLLSAVNGQAGTSECCTISRVCEWQELALRCPADKPAIHICDAIYGRYQPASVCPHPNILTTNCRASSSLSLVQDSCQGKQSCTVPATNSFFSDPCVGTFKYLQVSYRCARKSLVCEHSTLQLSCGVGESIVVLTASYGRSVGGNVACNHPQIHNLNCHASGSLNIVKSQCEGRNSCAVSASNGVFGDPCVGTYKYLEVFYDCV